MGYQALYRRYRPSVFREVIGQEHITTILKNQVASGRTSHAYLFSGTRGTGKTSVAKILARAVNCEHPVDGEPCLECEACRRSENGNVDIIELDAASNTGVDNIRDILEKVRFTPLELKTKVYIIDEAHGLSANAFNALLKTLEEPPAHVMFILATTEPQKILPTIISRCQRMDFHRLSVDSMLTCMKDVLKNAGASIDDEGLLAIARAADGGMRDALSLADQCISFVGENVTAEDVYSILGSMDDAFMFNMMDALIDSDAEKAVRLLDSVVSDGRDLRVFAHDMTLHARAVLMAKLCGPCQDVLDCTEDAMRRYTAQAERCGETRLLRATELLMDTEYHMRNIALPRVLIESALVRIARPEESRTTDDIKERMELLEQKLKEGIKAAAQARPAKPMASPASAPAPANAAQDAPEAAESPAADAVDAPAPYVDADAGALWNELRERFSAVEPAVAIVMRKAVSTEKAGGVLTASFDNQMYIDALMKTKVRIIMDEILKKLAPELSLEFRLVPPAPIGEMARALFGSGVKIT